MQQAHILDLIEAQTRTLVAEQLRSKAVVVARLLDLINQANQLGHTHESIHSRVVLAGLDTTLKDYSTYLYRARARAKKGGSYEPNNIGSYEPKREGKPPSPERIASPVSRIEQEDIPEQERTQEETETNSATSVVDSLNRASKIGNMDFSSIVRKQQRRPKGN